MERTGCAAAALYDRLYVAGGADSVGRRVVVMPPLACCPLPSRAGSPRLRDRISMCVPFFSRHDPRQVVFGRIVLAESASKFDSAGFLLIR